MILNPDRCPTKIRWKELRERSLSWSTAHDHDGRKAQFIRFRLSSRSLERCCTFYPSSYPLPCFLIFPSKPSVIYPPSLANGSTSYPKTNPRSFAMLLSFTNTRTPRLICSKMPCPSTRAALGRERRIGKTSVGSVFLFGALSLYSSPGPDLSAADSESTVLILILGRRSLQLHMSWEGNGRVVARLSRPPGSDVHRLKVDEKVGILITTHMLGGLSVTHLFSGVLLWSLPRVG